MNMTLAQSRRRFFGTISQIAVGATTLSLASLARAYDEDSPSDGSPTEAWAQR